MDCKLFESTLFLLACNNRIVFTPLCFSPKDINTFYPIVRESQNTAGPVCMCVFEVKQHREVRWRIVSHTIGLKFYSRLGVKQSQMLLDRASPTFFTTVGAYI